MSLPAFVKLSSSVTFPQGLPAGHKVAMSVMVVIKSVSSESIPHGLPIDQIRSSWPGCGDLKGFVKDRSSPN